MVIVNTFHSPPVWDDVEHLSFPSRMGRCCAVVNRAVYVCVYYIYIQMLYIYKYYNLCIYRYTYIAFPTYIYICIYIYIYINTCINTSSSLSTTFASACDKNINRYKVDLTYIHIYIFEYKPHIFHFPPV